VRSMLCATPVHISMAIAISPWVFSTTETLILGFLWCGTEVTSGGKCSVAWTKITCPLTMEG
jgi:hypothetical protein